MFDNSQPSHQRLRKIYAERTRGLIAWVGSGLSVPAGLPTWRDLRARLEDEAQRKARTLDTRDADRLLKNLSSIKSISDQWLAFDRLRDLLGQASFQASVRDALIPKPEVSCPEEYKLLWRLRIGGMLTLNLDRFAARAYVEEHRAVINEINGKDATHRLAILKSGAPFIVNLHGILDDSSSWVLTRDDLSKLISPAYEIFMGTMFATTTILFVGISADDVAAGGLLSRLRAMGADPGQHFWLTHRTDSITDEWAENSGIQVIRYSLEGSHLRELTAFYDDMRRYLPQDLPEVQPVLESPIEPSVELPPPHQLANEEPERIRQILAAHAKLILSGGSDESLRRYSEFRNRYQRAIHNAWYVSETPPENILFGNAIKSVIGTGAFAKVYHAVSPKGENVALKLLRAEVGQDERMLGSFRRGVRSMKILSDRKVPGMVPYREAYELPACSVMELIEGPNLQEAVESAVLDPWKDGLRIMLDTARIVRSGHLLPEQVLHRDIRPPNIMLKNYYLSPDNWEVVVLDFDLSWHRGATEKSIDLKAATALGYLAPEQVQDFEHISTRSAAVDAFGLGMTMAFVFTRVHPTPGVSARPSWEHDLLVRMRDLPKTKWCSLPRRLARLIARSTRIEQSRRIDFSEILTELERLSLAWLSPDSVEYAELWAEELLAHSFGVEGYKWDTDLLQGDAPRPGGLQISLRADEAHARIILQSGWAFSGEHDRRSIGKFLPSRVDQFVSRLKSGGWAITQRNVGGGNFNVTAEIGVNALLANPSNVITALNVASELIKF